MNPRLWPMLPDTRIYITDTSYLLGAFITAIIQQHPQPRLIVTHAPSLQLLKKRFL
jgi:hypothetical protein